MKYQKSVWNLRSIDEEEVQRGYSRDAVDGSGKQEFSLRLRKFS